MTPLFPGAMAPRRVAVLRALMLGDMLCATPALRALRRAWPRAHITLVGLPWAAEWARRQPSIDDFEPFPGLPGLPEQDAPTPEAVQAFVDRMQARELDLAVQLHGSGGFTNALVARFGARHRAGFFTPGTALPETGADRFVPWPSQGHEIERMLAVTDGLGVPRQGLALDWPLTADDRRRARALLPSGVRYAVVHPGAQLPSRRWPPERFSAVAGRLLQQGLAVVLTGSDSERELTRAVAAQLQHGACVDLAGRTDLWTLGGLLASATVLVSNDTGLSHVAAALGTPSVVIACGSEVPRWAPLDTSLHRVVWQDMDCRPCAHRVCPIGHGCALAVQAEPVAQMASALMDHRKTRDACTTD